ncbi:hypothetical protein [Fodinicola acaciae]|uniref:hypothetical protein n=1 Tax=Fodinicola acaciae TaxID=2681555 RepID=UPI0013D7D453|nr:hypothetical protein [Fodinicola acaciae]
MKIQSGLIAISAMAGIGLAVPAQAFSAPAIVRPASAVNGKITRSEVLTRSKSWIDEKVPYSQDNNSPHVNKYGSYRRDCSGFVSMSWHLSYSRTTADLPDVMHPIARKDLKPGDALLLPHTHIALFVGWADGAHTQPVVREEYDYGHVAEQRVWAAAKAGNYTPERYDNIVDDAVRTFDPKAVPSGTLLREPSGAIAVSVGGAPAVFANNAEITALGYAGSPIYPVARGFFAKMPSTPRETTLMRNSRYATALVVDGWKVPFASNAEIAASGYKGQPVIATPARFFDTVHTGLPDRALIRNSGNVAAVVVGTGKVVFNSNAEIDASGYRRHPVVRVPDRIFDSHPTSIPSGSLVGNSHHAAAVVIGAGKYVFASNADLASAGYRGHTVVEIPDRSFTNLSTGVPDGSLVRNSAGAVAVVVGGARVVFENHAEIVHTGYSAKPIIRIPDHAFAALARPMRDGTLVKSPANSTIWEIVHGHRVAEAGKHGTVYTIPTRVLDGIPRK